MAVVSDAPKDQLRILIVGSGGREHALVDSLNRSPLVDQIFVAPGNGGTANVQKTTNVNISSSDFDALVAFSVKNNVNLVIPGPEQPLVDGIETSFRQVGIPCFGPSVEAAAMEGSKTFSKSFMDRHQIPTAQYRNCSDFESAKKYLDSVDHKVVIKASGLAAGKGVIIPETKEEALQALEEIMVKKEFGSAGDEVVIEEFLTGQELSILAFCDGYTILPLPAAQDHKRIGEGDTGPNTGGMGAYSPAPIYTPALRKTIMEKVLQPSLDGMRKDRIPFVGLLFVGLMINEKGDDVKVLEYNVRFGDPETQTVLGLLDPSTDLAEVILACVERRLDCVNLKIRQEWSVSVVLASKGYPGSYPKNIPITIGPLPPNVKVFHAGTDVKSDTLVTSGGRVLAVNAVGPTLEDAVTLAYKGVDCVKFDGMTYRKDIAHRAKSSSSQQQTLTYAASGVSIDAGNSLVQDIKPIVKATARSGSDSDIGGFGGLFDLKAAGFKDPILVSGTDGVGTKLIVAQSMGVHHTVGIDLVAMSVNDLLVQGAEPLYFLDYFACSKLDAAVATDVIKGIADGCKVSGCALIGGETAEMPGMYQGDDYDLGGFAVGAVERTDVLPSPSNPVVAGDVLIGLTSSGVHSNGFSLVRKIISSQNLSYNSPCPWDARSETIGRALLEPTRIYIKQVLPSLKRIKAMSHITGGGFIDNIPRVLPKGLGAEVRSNAWELPPVFKWLMKAGNVQAMEMARTFNCGVGLVLIVNESEVDQLMEELRGRGGSQEAQVARIGTVVEGDGVRMLGMDSWC